MVGCINRGIWALKKRLGYGPGTPLLVPLIARSARRSRYIVDWDRNGWKFFIKIEASQKRQIRHDFSLMKIYVVWLNCIWNFFNLRFYNVQLNFLFLHIRNIHIHHLVLNFHFTAHSLLSYISTHFGLVSSSSTPLLILYHLFNALVVFRLFSLPRTVSNGVQYWLISCLHIWLHLQQSSTSIICTIFLTFVILRFIHCFCHFWYIASAFTSTSALLIFYSLIVLSLFMFGSRRL